MARSLLTLAKYEFTMTLRERAGWGGIIAACALAFADAALRPWVPTVGGIRASTFGGPMVFAPLAIIFVAGAARREEAVSANDVIGSRPYPSHMLLLARLLGNCVLVLFGYLLVILFSLLPALVFGGRVASLLTILYALARGATPLMYLATLAYCAVALSRNVLSAAVVAVYWLFVLLWSDFLARIFDFSLTQNWPTYALLGLSAAMGTVAIRRWLDREPWTSRWAPLLPTTALLLLLSGVLDAVWRVAESHDKPLRQDPFALQMAGQHLDGSPRVPGFWLPDQHSGMFRTASVNGRVLVIGFWSPHVPTSVLMLEQLRRVSQEFPKEQVTCIAVCVANDHAISPHVARAEAYDFPLVTDPGTHYAGRMTECSPVVEAFTVSDVPTIFITDRARRLVERIESTGPQAVEHLRVVVTRALTIPVPPLL